MFTGLIEGLCQVRSAGRVGGTAMRLSVDLGSLVATPQAFKAGDSIAVSGVCLTIAKIAGSIADFAVSGETLAKSTIGSLKAGAYVNIERAVAADGRFGGHFVLGHVDGIAVIKKIEKKEGFVDITFAAEKSLLDNMVAKGSAAIDGISLTVAELNKDSFSAAIVPETIKRTTLGTAKSGDKVNIETDLIVKTIKKQLEQLLPKQELTIEKLRELGF
jgi:riboflavin synthase